MSSTILKNKLECGVHSLPSWLREMLSEKMERVLQGEKDLEQEKLLEVSHHRSASTGL